jgi:sterol desaturase/sphingolipid hydroxylase (fatty acid hydroxylase superfamily)
MIEVILVSLIVFVITTLFGHVVHWSLHQGWAGKLNDAHMTHHIRLYPPSDYVSDVYRSPGKDNTVFIFGAAAIPLVITPLVLLLLGYISVFIMVWATVEMLVIGYMHDGIHDAFHVRKSFWHRVPGYSRWAELHYLHHVDMKTNYGIFFFGWDMVFNTLWKKN